MKKVKLIIELTDSEYTDLKGLYKLSLDRPAYKTFIEKICVGAIANGKAFEPKVNCKDCDGYEAGYSAGVRDTERPKGEWVVVPERCFIYCKECGHVKPFSAEEFKLGINFPDFCEGCGADMRTKDNNNA